MTDELRAHDVTKFTGLLDEARAVNPRSRRYFTNAHTPPKACEGCGVLFTPKAGSKGRFHSSACFNEFGNQGRRPGPHARRRAPECLPASAPTPPVQSPVHQFIPEVPALKRGSIALAMLGCRIYG